MFYEYGTRGQGGSEIGGIEWYQSWFELQWTMCRGPEGVFI